MNCEILTIGDELLIGQVVDTNSAWMAEKLNEAGVRVVQITTVSDDAGHIIRSIDAARKRSDIILMTGGLGPTRDDLTKDVLCVYFGATLVRDEKVIADLTDYFKSRGRDLTETNARQADVPDKCIPIYNRNGTAPGMWFEDTGKIFVSMPGVPYEMKGMMTEFVLPRIMQKFSLPPVSHFTIQTVGVGESFLADLLLSWETNLPDYFKLAYLPSTGMVRLRLSCYQASPERETEMKLQAEVAVETIAKYVFGFGDDTLESVTGNLLRDKNQTLAIAESCTGGYISHLVTSVPGSSDYYIGSTVSYANEVKSNFLDVSPDIIHDKGAVSEEVAIAMAKGVRDRLGSSWSISTTGIAGPGGGTPGKPVGTVWIGIAGPGCAFAHKFQFGTDRHRNTLITAVYALNLLRKQILEHTSTPVIN